jgi:hypothetical protein
MRMKNERIKYIHRQSIAPYRTVAQDISFLFWHGKRDPLLVLNFSGASPIF